MKNKVLIQMVSICNLCSKSTCIPSAGHTKEIWRNMPLSLFSIVQFQNKKKRI
uniref:Uncharacterized protein n=1 Tax=Rhizophora mucronata TaxID=61149 RepID=A0A2P2M304_RHIMU